MNDTGFHATILDLLCAPVRNNYCALIFRNPFELAVATILSAQCTDKRVNMVTPILFDRYPNIKAFAETSIEEIAKVIGSISFPNNKARHLHRMSQKVMTDFGGNLPATMEELTNLPGIARKTANVILIHGFRKIEGIPVDTHVLRVAHRIGLTSSSTHPEKTERELMKTFLKSDWPILGTSLIHHGRTICTARKPSCTICTLAPHCQYYLSQTL